MKMRMARLCSVAAAASALFLVAHAQPVRRTAVQPHPSDRPGFTLLKNADLGIAFTNRISDARVQERQNLMNGAGLAMGDFDRDGRPDLFICNKEGSSALYRNLGNWRFEDVTAAAQVACTNQSSSGATFADVNGDGWLDLFVTSFGGPNACFVNLQNGSFSNITAAAGFLFRENMTSVALADIDGDADLDLYINNFGLVSIIRDGFPMATRVINGVLTPIGRYAHRVRIVNGKMIELGEPDYLMRNDGRANFKPMPWNDFFRDAAGQPMVAPKDFGLAVQLRDINGDGFPDIYTCNDFGTPDRLWFNDGSGGFRAETQWTRRSMSYAAMGVDFADIDRDGDMDFVVVEMVASDPQMRLRQDNQSFAFHRNPGKFDEIEDAFRNTLFINNGDGTYSEIARLAGLAASDWSWCPIFLDVDLDGYEDLLVTNGNADDSNDLDRAGTGGKVGKNRAHRPLLTSNLLFRNRGDLTFADASAEWGFNAKDISHGMALADFDGDGDQDVAINSWNGPPLIYRNNAPAPRILVRLNGRGGNVQGIGSLVSLRAADGFTQSQEFLCGGRYMSGDDPTRTFACVAKAPYTLEVRWRSGRLSVVTNAEPNSIYEISEPETAPVPRVEPPKTKPMFADISDALGHTHQEDAVDDFQLQPLLPRRLSQNGPGVACIDINGDGADDLAIGCSTGTQVATFTNSGAGLFKGVNLATKIEIPSDVAGLVFLPAPSAKFLAARGKIIAIDPITGQEESIDLPANFHAGPLTLLDFDGDGDLDVFIGGIPRPGRYPEPADSCLLRKDHGTFRFDEDSSKPFIQAGIVNAAVATDLNGDGWADLALACEWGPIKIFINESGRFREATKSSGLEARTGQWLSINSGDFDGDGRMDLVAGNWGRNTDQERSRLYYGDWLRREVIDTMEARLNPANDKWIPRRFLTKVGAALPFVKQQFPTHAQYASASIDQILADAPQPVRYVESVSIESTLFLNRGDRFEARPLPIKAQFTPVFGIVVADFDGDSKEDLFLGQNFFATRTDSGRFDAGFGLMLRGHGDATFDTLSAAQSGIRVFGEQRGCATGDFDQDGRSDLAVTQNAAATKLFRNSTGKPGFRIRLRGPIDNPHGIGATIQLEAEGKLGAARHVRAGAGYLSQDSPVQIMNLPKASAVRVRWPGGKVQVSPVNAQPGDLVEVRYQP